jgi:nicotinate-nucleotide pyrophosphorylase (carboxylating)
MGEPMKATPKINLAAVRDAIRSALKEDVGTGDVTTLALVPAATQTTAVIVARHPCVIAGHDVAAEVFRLLDPRVRYQVLVRDGQRARLGEEVARIRGSARAILTAERTALNFLQRLTGIATLTRRFVDAVEKYGTPILDTRKTTPNLRLLEKYAVRCGGGQNHRFGLYDRILIKDNHRQLWTEQSGRMALDEAIRESHRRYPRLTVEVEVETDDQFRSALAGRPDWILLDNLTPPQLKRYVKVNRRRCKIEASGGVTVQNAAAFAATGVDAISVGSLTHSAPSADLSLEIAPPA